MFTFAICYCRWSFQSKILTKPLLCHWTFFIAFDGVYRWIRLLNGLCCSALHVCGHTKCPYIETCSVSFAISGAKIWICWVWDFHLQSFQTCASVFSLGFANAVVGFELSQDSWACFYTVVRVNLESIITVHWKLECNMYLETVSQFALSFNCFASCDRWVQEKLLSGFLHTGWSDVTESMVMIGSPFCGYNTI